MDERLIDLEDPNRVNIGTSIYLSETEFGITLKIKIYSINFYFKNGFIIEKTIDIEIGNGFVMDDFQMLKWI